MKRRTFIVGGICIVIPRAASGQPRLNVPKLGYLSNSDGSSKPDSAFLQRLRHLGYVDGRNLIVEARYTAGKSARFAEFATELVRSRVHVIAGWSPAAVAAAKNATDTIPIVGIAMGSDPVAMGWSTSLARPSSNVTGLTTWASALTAKRMELLKAALPTATILRVIGNRTSPAFPTQMKEVETNAAAMRLQLESFAIGDAKELAAALRSTPKAQSALPILPDGMLWAYRAEIVRMAAEKRLPAMYWSSDYTDVGGLMSYAESLADIGIRAAGYVDKILKGAKPADLPIEEPTKFEFIINSKTAKAFRLTIPPSVLERGAAALDVGTRRRTSSCRRRRSRS